MPRLVCLDIESQVGAPPNDCLVAVCIDGQVYERRVVGDEFLRELFTSIKDEVICGHNLKFDAKVIYQHYGILFENLWCTMVASKLLRNGKKNPDGSPVSNALVACLEYYLGKKAAIHSEKDSIRTNFSKKRPLTEKEVEYIKADVMDLKELQERLAALLEYDKLTTAFKLEMALIPVLIKKEVRGVRLDADKLKGLIRVWQRGKRIAIGMLDREIERLMPLSKKPMLFAAYNYGSTAQITQIFKDFGQPVPTKEVQEKKRTVVKESNDADALTEYQYNHPESKLLRFIEIYLWYKEIEKLLSTYGETLLAKVDANGYIHTEYNQLGAESSRLSSSGPNLQNVGNKGHGAKVRTCFLPDEGDVFVDSDMDGAEIRIAGDLSGEPLLIANVTQGADMHSQLTSATYSIITGQPVTIKNEKTPIYLSGQRYNQAHLRTKHKAIVFSFFYGASAKRVYTILGDDIRRFQPTRVRETCKEIHDELKRQMPVLSAWFEQVIEEAKMKGYLRLRKTNRIRYFSKDVHGAASNQPIQGLNAEAIKLAMIKMDRWLTQTGYGRLVLNVHDQLVTSCKPEVAKEVGEMQAKIMSDSLSYFLTSIKGSSSYKITSCWEK